MSNGYTTFTPEFDECRNLFRLRKREVLSEYENSMFVVIWYCGSPVSCANDV